MVLRPISKVFQRKKQIFINFDVDAHAHYAFFFGENTKFACLFWQIFQTKFVLVLKSHNIESFSSFKSQVGNFKPLYCSRSALALKISQQAGSSFAEYYL
jgi:hypothetical protein